MPTISRLVLALALGSALSACATSGASRLAEGDGVVVPVAGAPLSLGSVAREHAATVLVWWSSSCPCVRRYAERVRDVAARRAAEDVAFYYVASNADDGAEVVSAAEAALPIVRDEGGVLATALGVVSTPTVVVVDRAGRVVFHGWLDNEHTPDDAGREAWLDDALTRLAAGDATPARTPTWGCMITRSLGEARPCHAPAPVVAPAPAARCGGH